VLGALLMLTMLLMFTVNLCCCAACLQDPDPADGTACQWRASLLGALLIFIVACVAVVHALQDPEAAVAKACQWRVATLGALCAESLGVVAEAIKKRSSGREQWQFRQLTRNLTGGTSVTCTHV
jgi:hypothetical protein